VTTTPGTDTRGRRALLWSFFVPPVGLVLGVRILLTTAATPDTSSVRTEAKLAIVNCVVATVLVVKGIGLLLWLRERLPAMLE
jgi:hypothetical protein